MLIVLGKNIGVGSTPEDIRNRPKHLSGESELNVLAAGMAWQPGMDILFSTGQTAGPDVPGEAVAMRDLFKAYFPDVPDECLLLEDRSIDTAGNAEEVAKLLPELEARRRRVYKHIGLLTVGYHVNNAATLFERNGVPIEQKLVAEDIVATLSPEHAAYVERRAKSERVKQEIRKEFVRFVLLHTVDRKGELLRRVTSKTRK